MTKYFYYLEKQNTDGSWSLVDQTGYGAITAEVHFQACFTKEDPETLYRMLRYEVHEEYPNLDGWMTFRYLKGSKSFYNYQFPKEWEEKVRARRKPEGT